MSTNDQEAADFPLATTAQLTAGTVKFTAVIRGGVNPDGTVTPSVGYSATAGQVADIATPAAAAQALAAAAGVAPIVISAATTLVAATHGGMTLVLQPGTQITVDWSQTGNGFACLLINRSGGIIAPALVGFTGSLPINGSGEIAIPSPGAASLYCLTPDGGTTAECWLVGDTAS